MTETVTQEILKMNSTEEQNLVGLYILGMRIIGPVEIMHIGISCVRQLKKRIDEIKIAVASKFQIVEAEKNSDFTGKGMEK